MSAQVPDLGGWLRGVADVAVALRRGQHALVRRYTRACLDAGERAARASVDLVRADSDADRASGEVAMGVVEDSARAVRRARADRAAALRRAGAAQARIDDARNDIVTFRSALSALDLPPEVLARVLARVDDRLAAMGVV